MGDTFRRVFMETWASSWTLLSTSADYSDLVGDGFVYSVVPDSIFAGCGKLAEASSSSSSLSSPLLVQIIADEDDQMSGSGSGSSIGGKSYREGAEAACGTDGDGTSTSAEDA